MIDAKRYTKGLESVTGLRGAVKMVSFGSTVQVHAKLLLLQVSRLRTTFARDARDTPSAWQLCNKGQCVIENRTPTNW